jgi:hypothetical protein
VPVHRAPGRMEPVQRAGVCASRYEFVAKALSVFFKVLTKV